MGSCHPSVEVWKCGEMWGTCTKNKPTKPAPPAARSHFPGRVPPFPGFADAFSSHLWIQSLSLRHLCPALNELINPDISNREILPSQFYLNAFWPLDPRSLVPRQRSTVLKLVEHIPATHVEAEASMSREFAPSSG